MRNDKQKGAAAVCALQVTVDSKGAIKLDKLNEQLIDGDIPCYVSTDRDGKFAFLPITFQARFWFTQSSKTDRLESRFKRYNTKARVPNPPSPALERTALFLIQRIVGWWWRT